MDMYWLNNIVPSQDYFFWLDLDHLKSEYLGPQFSGLYRTEKEWLFRAVVL